MGVVGDVSITHPSDFGGSTPWAVSTTGPCRSPRKTSKSYPFIPLVAVTYGQVTADTAWLSNPRLHVLPSERLGHSKPLRTVPLFRHNVSGFQSELKQHDVLADTDAVPALTSQMHSSKAVGPELAQDITSTRQHGK